MELGAVEVSVIGLAGFLTGLGTIYRYVRGYFKKRFDMHVRFILLEHRQASDPPDWEKLKVDLLKGLD